MVKKIFWRKKACGAGRIESLGIAASFAVGCKRLQGLTRPLPLESPIFYKEEV